MVDRRWILGVALAAATAGVFNQPLSAQWQGLRTPGVPRLPDGKPNFDAPAPKTPDGKPDFSGNWIRGDGQLGPAGGFSAPAWTKFSQGPPVSTFRSVAANMKEGLPLRPEAAALQRARDASNSKDNPDAHCLPMGIMQFHNHGMPRKVIQTPSLIAIAYEANYGLRYIHMDGRALPKREDVVPWWYGYSVGRWEGDTLVVESTGFKDGDWLDIIGNPMTDAARVTERYRRPTFGTLEIDVTVDDAKAYTRPWTVRINQQILVDTDIIEFICHENQQFDDYLSRQK